MSNQYLSSPRWVRFFHNSIFEQWSDFFLYVASIMCEVVPCGSRDWAAVRSQVRKQRWRIHCLVDTPQIRNSSSDPWSWKGISLWRSMKSCSTNLEARTIQSQRRSARLGCMELEQLPLSIMALSLLSFISIGKQTQAGGDLPRSLHSIFGLAVCSSLVNHFVSCSLKNNREMSCLVAAVAPFISSWTSFHVDDRSGHRKSISFGWWHRLLCCNCVVHLLGYQDHFLRWQILDVELM